MQGTYEQFGQIPSISFTTNNQLTFFYIRDRPFTMAGDRAECIFLIHVNFSYPYKLFIKFFIPLQKVLEIFHTPTYGPQYSSTTCSLIRIRCFSSIPPCPLRVRLFYFKCNLYAGNSTVYINTMQD